MNRKGSVDDREVPSIIEEIVIYDKPNKPLVPHEIFPQSTNFRIVKGDIILSRSREIDSSGGSTQKSKGSDPVVFKTFREKKLKSEPVEIEEIFEYESESDDGLIANIKATQPLKDNKLPIRDSVNQKAGSESLEDDDLSEPEESIENITKEIFKLSSKSPGVSIDKESRKYVKKTVKPSTDAVEAKKNEGYPKTKVSPKKKQNIKESKKIKESIETNQKTVKVLPNEFKEDEDSPFKRPRGRPKKFNTTTAQKSTILKYVVKTKDNLQFAESSKKTSESSNVTDTSVQSVNKTINKVNDTVVTSPTENSSGDVRQKRVRRRPKKYEDEEMIVEETSLGRYSNEDDTFASPSKRKMYTELTSVFPWTEETITATQDVSTDNLEELLDEAQEQVRTLNEVEAELESLVKGGQLPQKSTKNSSKKSSAKTPGKRGRKPDQQKITDMLEKNIKKEIVEDAESLVVSHEEAYGSDEDSRTEWVPEEYAEYKQQHIMKLINKMHKCKFCSSEFSSYYALRKHRALEHDDVGRDIKESTFGHSETGDGVQDEDEASDEESRGEWLPEDYAEYKMKHSLNKMKRSQWYKCKICCAVFSNYYKLSKHRVEHENKTNPYECKQCVEKFKDVESLTAHIRIHQGKDPYKCKKCEKGFTTKEELDAHIPVHILKKAPPPIKRFRCDLCSKEFCKLCDIERHTRVHTGEKPSECNICHKRFQQSHNLSKHLLTHLQVKPFQCEICNKKFGRVDVLNRHLLTHSMEKPYKCDICNKGFIRESQLTNHFDKLHPDVDYNLAEMENGNV